MHGVRPAESKYACILHVQESMQTPMSPCRGICKSCGCKKVHGYTNPDHITNPFGYLFLIPQICCGCSEERQACMWCRFTINREI